MRSILSFFAVLAFVACQNPTAPHNTDNNIAGVYVQQNVRLPFVADTVTITPLGANIEKIVKVDGDSIFTIVNYGSYSYDATTHTLIRQNGNFQSVWHFNGHALTSGSQIFIKVEGSR